MTSNLSAPPSAAWIARAAEQVRERGLSRLAASLLASAARRGLKVEWSKDPEQQYATIHQAGPHESHYIMVVWYSDRTSVFLFRLWSPFRGGRFSKKISGRDAATWMTVLEGK